MSFMIDVTVHRPRRGTGSPRKPRVSPASALVLAALVGVWALALAFSPVAYAQTEFEFGGEGSGAGQWQSTGGIAVSSVQGGDVYVVDRGNERVNEYSSAGVFLRAWGAGVADGVTHAPEVCTATCFPGLVGERGGEFHMASVEQGVAVNDNELEGTSGDVYVADRENARVQRLSPSGAFELTFGGEVNETKDHTGGATEEEKDICTAASGDLCKRGTEGSANGQLAEPIGIAIGPSGDVYVGGRGGIKVFSPNGAFIAQVVLQGMTAGGFVHHFAVDGDGDIYAEAEGVVGVRKYSPTGEQLLTVDGESVTHWVAMGPPATKEVFVVDSTYIRVYRTSGVEISQFAIGTIGPNGVAWNAASHSMYLATEPSIRVIEAPPPGPRVVSESATGIRPDSATIGGTIDPDSAEAADETHYRVQYGTSEAYGLESAVHSMPGSFKPTATSPIALGALQPSTTYDYRIVASDQCEKQPETEPGVKSECTTFGENHVFTTLPPVLVEAEWSADVKATSATLHAKLDPLGSATTYRFVYGPTSACGGVQCSVPVAGEAIGSGEGSVEVEQHVQGLSPGAPYRYRIVASNGFGQAQGEELSLTTQVAGEAGLPDGRSWELVSPPDKHGAGLAGIDENDYIQAAASGRAVVYPSSGPTEARPQGNGEWMQVYAKRTGQGWSSTDLQEPQSSPTGIAFDMEYELFNPELTLGVLQPFGRFNQARSSEATEQTAYLTNFETGVHTPLVTRANDTAEHFEPFGGEAEGECPETRCGPQFATATPDFSHIVLQNGKGSLEQQPWAAGAGKQGVYEWTAGHLTLVSIAPGGGALTGNAKLAEEHGSHLHDVSNDGTRVFFTDHNDNKVYLRDLASEKTVEIGSGKTFFEGADASGELAFYSENGGSECRVTVGGTGELECSVVSEHDGLLLGLSEDGSWTYFDKNGELLVRHDGGPPSLIARNVDVFGGLVAMEVGEATALEGKEDPWRVSPNGEWFAFMSNQPLTGYDNRDVSTGERDEEVYLYDAVHAKLVCASCNPTGGRPHGVDAQERGIGADGISWPVSPARTRIAASVAPWGSYENQESLYQPRFLSDSGRLFFDSEDGLVARDVNGQQDVYEFEPLGLGSCKESTATGTDLFVGSAGGCVALISSGESPQASAFVDASESGEDVFFLSSQRLTPRDLDGSLSLWDAHVCSQPGVPCFDESAGEVGPCETESSCKAPPSPQPSIFGQAPSATFSGPGNVTPVRSAVVKPKALTRAQLLARRLGECRRKYRRSRKRRVACERSARRASRAKRATVNGGLGR